ncbi:hypothetical protein [Lentibacter sp. XHP0401]|uniref:hypothetical protein n=1 Tax=Lentibacter sp. XHP0401 TaxID=2984334 RepID=UPI0021E83A35|nr:hypothetical protein [Lentibacter sp. XHP0401]MCV2894511.1 hypothetical protein [Lentibacter sp. XHP0401]
MKHSLNQNTKAHVAKKPRIFDRNIFQEVNAAALPQLESLCSHWLGQGRKEGREYVALNPTRADNRLGSFRINLISGKWADFATGDRGGDAISFYAYIEGMSQIEAARALAIDLGVAS